MKTFNVYCWRGSNDNVERVWRGEAASAPHAVVQAWDEIKPDLCRFKDLFARWEGSDPYSKEIAR